MSFGRDGRTNGVEWNRSDQPARGMVENGVADRPVPASREIWELYIRSPVSGACIPRPGLAVERMSVAEARSWL